MSVPACLNGDYVVVFREKERLFVVLGRTSCGYHIQPEEASCTLRATCLVVLLTVLNVENIDFEFLQEKHDDTAIGMHAYYVSF